VSAVGTAINSSCPQSEWSHTFLKGMLARMEVSFHKYGAAADAYPHRVNALKSAAERIEKYRQTGNTEWLIDAANFLMLEFMHPSLPYAEFRPTDSGESPGRVWWDTRAKNLDNEGSRL
jgi:hypothetical protein